MFLADRYVHCSRQLARQAHAMMGQGIVGSVIEHLPAGRQHCCTCGIVTECLHQLCCACRWALLYTLPDAAKGDVRRDFLNTVLAELYDFFYKYVVDCSTVRCQTLRSISAAA